MSNMPSSGLPPHLVSAIKTAANALTEGGLVIYPTETYYGLGAAVSRPDAVHRLGSLKGRAAGKPMPIIVADEASARSLWREVPAAAEIFMRRFWPGPLTLVLPARSGLPFELAPSGEVGIRVSSHPVAHALATIAGPVVATSANLSGSSESTVVPQIEAALRQAVQRIVDAGPTPGGLPSTVLGFKGDEPVILREGAIQKALIDACRT